MDALLDRLRQVDPLAAHRIDRGDTRRMIRALEVVKLTGVPMSHRQNQFDQGRQADRCCAFTFRWPRAELHDRINRRVKAMFRDGLVEEVRGLIQHYGELSRTARQAVGYRELLPLMPAQLTPHQVGEVEAEVAAHTRQLARRQETWLRSFSEITPVEISGKLDIPALVDRIERHYESVRAETAGSPESR